MLYFDIQFQDFELKVLKFLSKLSSYSIRDITVKFYQTFQVLQ